MANPLTAKSTSNLLHQMRCCLCKAYLSCSPVSLLPNGSSICSTCTPADSNVQVYRNLPLEKFLRQLPFPCKFKERGCTNSYIFDKAAEHELKCIYQSFLCPSSKPCEWVGLSSEVIDHFKHHHVELIKENAEFKFKMNEDAKGLFIIGKDNVLFVVKYSYNVHENCLKYDIRYFMNAGNKEGTYSVQLGNDENADCNFSLNSNKCLVFDDSFYNAKNSQILKLSKYLDILDHPTTVKVIIDLEVIESTNQDGNLVDYELLHLYNLMRAGANYYTF